MMTWDIGYRIRKNICYFSMKCAGGLVINSERRMVQIFAWIIGSTSKDLAKPLVQYIRI